jgi:hypothetical protein
MTGYIAFWVFGKLLEDVFPPGWLLDVDDG